MATQLQGRPRDPRVHQGYARRSTDHNPEEVAEHGARARCYKERLRGPTAAEPSPKGLGSDVGGLKRSAQQCLHLLSWCAPLECFSGAAVELCCDLVKLDSAARSQVELSR